MKVIPRTNARCPSCGNAQFHPESTVRDQGNGLEFHLGKCRSCGLVRLLDDLDESSYREMYDGNAHVHTADDLTRRTYDVWLDRFQAFRKTGRLLEVGFGAGSFLEHAATRGWSCYGTEIGDTSVPRLAERFPPGHLHHGYLEDAPFIRNLEVPFDVAVLIEVLEHIPDPSVTVATLKRVLRPGGALWLTVPNYSSASRRLLRERWREFTLPRHVTFFTQDTLKRFLHPRGFSVQRIETRGFNVVDAAEAIIAAVRGGRATGIPDVTAPKDERVKVAVEHKKRVDKLRQVLARVQPVKHMANRALDVAGWGDSLHCLARLDQP